MYITPGMLLLGFLAYIWFSQPPRQHFDCGGACCAKRNGRDPFPEPPSPLFPPVHTRLRQQVPPVAVPIPGRLSYLWLPLGLAAFVALSLLAHVLVPR
jgi:hypothetical protein